MWKMFIFIDFEYLFMGVIKSQSLQNTNNNDATPIQRSSMRVNVCGGGGGERKDGTPFQFALKILG